MDVDEFKAFIDVLDNQYSQINRQAYTLLRLGAFTGMRTEKLLALQWRHIDFDNGYVSITQALGRGLGGAPILKNRRAKRVRKHSKLIIRCYLLWQVGMRLRNIEHQQITYSVIKGRPCNRLDLINGCMM